MGGLQSSVSDFSSTEVSPTFPTGSSIGLDSAQTNSTTSSIANTTSIPTSLLQTSAQIQSMSGSSPSLPVKTPSTKTNIAATVPDNGPTQSVMTSVSHSESAPRVADSSAQTASSLATLSSKAASVKATSSHSSAKSSKLATTGTKAPLSPVTSPTVSFTATSTITDTPESTLAKPSFVSVIESNANGQTTAFTAPPFLTFLSTSTETNGSLVTFTHIVANPTGFNQAIGHSASFFHNAGAVAGVFLVVGAIMTGLVVFALFLLCRRQRRRRELHRRWLVSMHRPRPLSDNDTFVNPEMRSFDRPWDGRISSPHGHYTVAPPRRVDPPMLLGGQNNNRGPQAGPYDDAIGLAITTDDHRDNPSVESSPSIYPASLPPTAEDEPVQPLPPPRPRRSHLRDSSKAQLITPPSSVSSHSPVHDAVNPFLAESESPSVQNGGVQLNEIMGRRTLLDVRPMSQGSIEWQRR